MTTEKQADRDERLAAVLAEFIAERQPETEFEPTEPPTEECYSREELSALIDKRVSEENAAKMRVHIRGCAHCRNQCMNIAVLKMGAMHSGGGIAKRVNGSCLGVVTVLGMAMVAAIVFFSHKFINTLFQ
ncbi:zf-HC2 domain-containing protein [Desulforhopalus vacuolatus]|uniref:zf-HC2 domain-containing protein n=1 Tax=Desulforhopalus vacuolatus TaxID=40414 RepID=UPI001966BF76|nr:zf-HC2 domain-containing protein [Desulforhopalus vacuolatus]MBM9519451.1 zf-HC2 domain-containing protein [Desulforhopalus vacuolatus]